MEYFYPFYYQFHILILLQRNMGLSFLSSLTNPLIAYGCLETPVNLTVHLPGSSQDIEADIPFNQTSCHQTGPQSFRSLLCSCPHCYQELLLQPMTSVGEFFQGFHFLKYVPRVQDQLGSLPYAATSFTFVLWGFSFRLFSFPMLETGGSKNFYSSFLKTFLTSPPQPFTKQCTHIYMILFDLISEYTDLASSCAGKCGRLGRTVHFTNIISSCPHIKGQCSDGTWVEITGSWGFELK